MYIPVEDRLPTLKKRYRIIFWEVDADETNAGTYKYDEKSGLWHMYTRTDNELNFWHTVRFINTFSRDTFFYYKKVLFANYAHTEKRYYNRLLKILLEETADKVYVNFTKNRE